MEITKENFVKFAAARNIPIEIFGDKEFSLTLDSGEKFSVYSTDTFENIVATKQVHTLLDQLKGIYERIRRD